MTCVALAERAEKESGCTVCVDGWTDRQKAAVLGVLVTWESDRRVDVLECLEYSTTRATAVNLAGMCRV